MSVPIESTTISLGRALALATAVIAAAFTVGGWVVRVEVRQAELEERLDQNGRLLNGICRAVACDAKGMRE